MAKTDHLPRDPLSNLLTVDERAEWLMEYEKDKPGHGLHRYQVIRVRRGQFWRDFVKELGPAMLYQNVASALQMWLAGEYSVGEAMDQADAARETKPPQQREPTDLMEGYFRQVDEIRALRAHRSVSGPLVRIERR